jgi:uracil-DNA glycosylase
MGVNLLPNSIHPTWGNFLTIERKNQIKAIGEKIGNNFTPRSELVLRFLQLDLKAIRVVILGLDPYPEYGVATGRSFEVGGLTSWHSPFKQASMRNIIRLLYKDYNSIKEYDNIPKFNLIREKMLEGSFIISPPNKLFSDWELQGVLLLNSYFTTEVGIQTANSHRDIWENFSISLFGFITKENDKISWFLWGNEAQKVLSNVSNKSALICNHPSRVSKHNEGDFLKYDGFLKTMGIINWLGFVPEQEEGVDTTNG